MEAQAPRVNGRPASKGAPRQRAPRVKGRPASMDAIACASEANLSHTCLQMKSNFYLPNNR